MQSKMMFALSLTRKAGGLIMGFDSVKESVNKGKAVLVLCASDVSEGTRRRVGTFCEGWVEIIDMAETQFELSQISKKPTGVFAVIDSQLAALCQKSAQNKEERPCP